MICDSIQNGLSAMEICLLQKFNGNRTTAIAIVNLNRYTIDSGQRNQTKCYPQSKLYLKGKRRAKAHIFQKKNIISYNLVEETTCTKTPPNTKHKENNIVYT